MARSCRWGMTRPVRLKATFSNMLLIKQLSIGSRASNFECLGRRQSPGVLAKVEDCLVVLMLTFFPKLRQGCQDEQPEFHRGFQTRRRSSDYGTEREWT